MKELSKRIYIKSLVASILSLFILLLIMSIPLS